MYFWLSTSVESLGKGGAGSDCDCQSLCERDEYNIMTSYAPLSMAMNRRLTLSTALPENYWTVLRLQVNVCLFRLKLTRQRKHTLLSSWEWTLPLWRDHSGSMKFPLEVTLDH